MADATTVTLRCHHEIGHESADPVRSSSCARSSRIIGSCHRKMLYDMTPNATNGSLRGVERGRLGRVLLALQHHQGEKSGKHPCHERVRRRIAQLFILEAPVMTA